MTSTATNAGSASEQLVTSTIEARVARVVLDRPAAHNQLNSVMMAQLCAALTAAASSDADVLVITANGPDFSIGRDQDEVLPPTMSRSENIRLIVDANRALAAFPGISVAAVQGRARGFACGLAIQADLTLAADTASFGFDEVHRGRPPRFVMAYLADFVGPKRALDLVVTGRLLDASEAGRFAMVNRVVPEQSLAARTESLVAGLLKHDRPMLRTCKAFPREVRRLGPDRRDEYAFAQTVGGRRTA